jgi:hypothetical protein
MYQVVRFTLFICAFSVLASCTSNNNVWTTYGGSTQRLFQVTSPVDPPELSWVFKQVSTSILHNIVASSQGVLIYYAGWPTYLTPTLFAISMETGEFIGNHFPGEFESFTIGHGSTSDTDILYALNSTCAIIKMSISAQSGLSLIDTMIIPYSLCSSAQLNANREMLLVTARDSNYWNSATYLTCVNISTGAIISEANFTSPLYSVSPAITMLTSLGSFSLAYSVENEIGWARFNVDTGKDEWFIPIQAKSSSYITYPAMNIKEDHMFFQTSTCDDDDGSCTPQLYSIDTVDGLVDWIAELELGGYGGNNGLDEAVVLSNLSNYDFEYLVVVYSYGYIYAYDPYGNRVWAVSGNLIQGVTFNNEILLYNGKLLSETGTAAGHISPGFYGCIIDQNNNFFVYNDDVIQVLQATAS